MPTFSYDAKNKTGDRVSGIIDALEERGAASALREQGLWPTRIEAVSAGAFSAPAFSPSPAAPAFNGGAPAPPFAPPVGTPTRVEAAPFLVSVPLPILVMMYRQLATLLNAGVPMVQALTTLVNQTQNGRLKQILTEMSRAVAGGNPLSSVMERYPAVFASMEIEMIRAGEASGMLERMCNRIADYLEREVEIRRKLKRETLYPKIVLFVAVCVLLLLGFLKSGANGFKRQFVVWRNRFGRRIRIVVAVSVP